MEGARQLAVFQQLVEDGAGGGSLALVGDVQRLDHNLHLLGNVAHALLFVQQRRSKPAGQLLGGKGRGEPCQWTLQTVL